jgi:hypothetical protein
MSRLLPRGPQRPLTAFQEHQAIRHYSRLLERHPEANRADRGWQRALLKANAICLALHPERCTAEHGKRLIRQLAAKRTNQKLRGQGRTPGAEGRAQIVENRKARKFSQQMKQRYGRKWYVGQANADGI